MIDIAKLAQLSLSQEELASLERDFHQISSLFEQIAQDSPREFPKPDPLAMRLPRRPDEVSSTRPDLLLMCAPSMLDGLFITPAAIWDGKE